MKNIITDTNLESATLAQLKGIATASMIDQAHEFATAAIGNLSDPVGSARDMVIASYLRYLLQMERIQHARFMSQFAQPNGGDK